MKNIELRERIKNQEETIAELENVNAVRMKISYESISSLQAQHCSLRSALSKKTDETIELKKAIKSQNQSSVPLNQISQINEQKLTSALFEEKSLSFRLQQELMLSEKSLHSLEALLSRTEDELISTMQAQTEKMNVMQLEKVDLERKVNQEKSFNLQLKTKLVDVEMDNISLQSKFDGAIRRLKDANLEIGSIHSLSHNISSSEIMRLTGSNHLSPDMFVSRSMLETVS